ncbi:MAG: hypothetical protein MHM6MM_007400 [Cercozoa sp. M6MM]
MLGGSEFEGTATRASIMSTPPTKILRLNRQRSFAHHCRLHHVCFARHDLSGVLLVAVAGSLDLSGDSAEHQHSDQIERLENFERFGHFDSIADTSRSRFNAWDDWTVDRASSRRRLGVLDDEHSFSQRQSRSYATDLERHREYDLSRPARRSRARGDDLGAREFASITLPAASRRAESRHAERAGFESTTFEPINFQPTSFEQAGASGATSFLAERDSSADWRHKLLHWQRTLRQKSALVRKEAEEIRLREEALEKRAADIEHEKAKVAQTRAMLEKRVEQIEALEQAALETQKRQKARALELQRFHTSLMEEQRAQEERSKQLQQQAHEVAAAVYQLDQMRAEINHSQSDVAPNHQSQQQQHNAAVNDNSEMHAQRENDLAERERKLQQKEKLLQQWRDELQRSTSDLELREKDITAKEERFGAFLSDFMPRALSRETTSPMSPPTGAPSTQTD